MLEDGFDDHDEVASLREEAVLRRRASSFDADHVQKHAWRFTVYRYFPLR